MHISYKLLLSIFLLTIYRGKTQVLTDTVRNSHGKIYQITKHNPPLKTVTKYTSNGNIRSVTTYKNDKKHGEYITYHKNGNIDQISEYNDDKLIGKFTQFYANGQLKSISNHKEIQNWNKSFRIVKDGWEKSFTETGEIKDAIFHLKGKEIYKYITNTYRVPYLEYNPDGMKLLIELYPDGTPLSITLGVHGYGLYEYFLKNGQAVHHKHYINSPKNSVWEYQLDGRGNIIKEIEDGTTEILFPDTTLDNQIIDLANSPIADRNYITGPIVLNSIDGKPKIEFSIKDMLLDGDFHLYNPDGSIFFKSTYKSGVPIKDSYVLNNVGDTIMFRTYKDGVKRYSNEIVSEGKREELWYDSLGAQIKVINYLSNQSIESYYDKHAKIYRTYWPNGNLKREEYPHPEDTLLRVHNHYFENGNPKQICNRNIEDREVRGAFKQYHENGQLKLHMFRDKNGFQNEAITYDEFGDILKKGRYINGKKEGIWIETSNGVKSEVLYLNNIGQVKNTLDPCYCIDTAYTYKNNIINRLVNVVDYKTYLNTHIDLLEPISKEDYEHIFIKQLSTGDHLASLNIILLRQLQVDLKGLGNSKLSLNPCFTSGYLSQKQAFYREHPSKINSRQLDLYDMNLRLDMDMTKLQSKLISNHFSFSFKADKLIFNEENGLKTKPLTPEFCFIPINSRTTKNKRSSRFISRTY